MSRFARFVSSAAFVMAISTPANAACTFPRWDTIANTLVGRAAGISGGEAVVILHDPSLNQGLVPALREAVSMHGATILAEIPRPSESQQQRILAMPDDGRLSLQRSEDRAYARLFQDADVLLWLDGSVVSDPPKRWERLLANAPALRSVHFHWFMPDEPAEQCEVARIYERAIAVSPDDLRVVQARLVAAMRGTTVRMTSSEGTDLRLIFATNARFNLNDGVTSREDTARARSVRDREEELPASAVRTIDVSADGLLVARLLNGSPSDRVRIRFSGGKVTEMTGTGAGYERFRRAYDARTGDRDVLAEFLLGANPLLARIMPSGYLPYFGVGGGNVHIRIGDNWESGGTNVVPGHWQGIFVVTDATLSVNGQAIVRDGELTGD